MYTPRVLIIATFVLGFITLYNEDVQGTVQLISDLTNFNVVNGQLTAERVVTVLCPSTSWGSEYNQTLELRSPTNTTDQVAFVCERYTTNYQAFVAGYVPPRGKLFEQQVCSRRTNEQTVEELRRMRYDVFNYSRDSVVPLSAEDIDKHRNYRILRRQQVEDKLRKGVRTTRKHQFETMNVPGSSLISTSTGLEWSDWKSFNTFGTKANAIRTSALNVLGPGGAAINVLLDIFGVGGNKNKELINAIKQLETRQSSVENAYSQLDARMDEQQAALIQVQQSLVTYTGATETLIMGVASQANIAQETAENVGDAVIALREEVTHTRAVQQQMIGTLRKSTQILAAQTNAIYNTLGDINDVVNDGFSATQTEFQTVYGVITNVTSRSHQALLEVYGAINANEAKTDDAIRRLVRSLGNTQHTLVDAIQDTTALRALVALVQARFAIMSVNETDLTPLLLDYGNPPDPYALIPDDLSTPMVEVEIIDIFLSPSVSPTTLRHQRLVFRCNVYFLMEYTNQVSGWRDVYDTIGTTQCGNATTGIEQLQTCKCTVEIITTSCTRANDAARDTFITSPAVTGITGDMCDGGIVPSPTTTLVTSVTRLSNEIGITCGLGSSHTSGIRVASVLRKQTGFAAHVPIACGMDLGDIREGSVSSISVPFHVLQYLQYALQISVVYADVYRPLIDGEMPNGMTYRTTPVSTIDGRNARCTTAAYTAYDLTPASMIPVINYKATDSGARASVWINGVEYSATTTTIASLGLGDAPTSFVSIGNPSNPFSAVDAPQHMLPLSTNPFARENTPLYAMFPTRIANASGWSSANGGIQFDAYSGSVDVSSLTRPVDPSTGRCARDSTVQYGLSQAGSVCEMKEFGRFIAAPSSNAPHDVVYTPAGSSANAAYIATFRVPIGDLVGILYSKCPSFSAVPVSADVTRVLLSNSGQQPITVDLQLNGRCVRDQRVTILPQTPFTIDVRDCPNPNIELQMSTLSVFTLDGQLCEGYPQNVTTTREEFVSAYGNADITWVSKITRVVDNNLKDAMRKEQMQLAELTFLLISTTLDMATLNGFAIPPRTVNAFDDILNRTQAIAIDIEDARDKFNDAFTENEERMDEQLALFASKTATFDAEWRGIMARYNESIRAAANARNQTDENLSAYRNASNALNTAVANYVEAEERLKNATREYVLAQIEFNRGVIATFWTLTDPETAGAPLIMFIITLILILCLCVCMCYCVRRATSSYGRGRVDEHSRLEEETVIW